MYNISVKDHIAVGGYVTNLGLQGVDFREDVSYQILPDPFDTNETWTYFSVDPKGKKKEKERQIEQLCYVCNI